MKHNVTRYSVIQLLHVQVARYTFLYAWFEKKLGNTGRRKSDVEGGGVQIVVSA
jgi:hypothetical protein